MMGGGQRAGGTLLGPFTALLSPGQGLTDVFSGGLWITMGCVIPNVFVSCLSLENRLNALLIHLFQENIFCNYYRKCCNRKGKGVGPYKCDPVGKGVSWAPWD